MSHITVENLDITDLRPQLGNSALAKYLPKYYFAKQLKFDISPVSNAVANAIRRTVSMELLVKAMYAEYDDLVTTDDFIIPEMLLQRLSMIPLDQSCSLDAVFELYAENKTANVRDVKSEEFRIVRQGKDGAMKHIPFNNTITFVTLQPGKSVKISNIRVRQAYGYQAGHGMHSVAVNATSVALDQRPIDMYDILSSAFSNELGSEPVIVSDSRDSSAAKSAASKSESNQPGIPSSISDPRKWRIGFITNGTMDPLQIVAAACDNLIKRVTGINDLLSLIENTGDEYVLVVRGETDTIGNLFMRTISDLFPNIRAVTYMTSSIEWTCTIRVRCDEDINDIYGKAIAVLVEQFKSIKKFFG